MPCILLRTPTSALPTERRAECIQRTSPFHVKRRLFPGHPSRPLVAPYPSLWPLFRYLRRSWSPCRIFSRLTTSLWRSCWGCRCPPSGERGDDVPRAVSAVAMGAAPPLFPSGGFCSAAVCLTRRLFTRSCVGSLVCDSWCMDTAVRGTQGMFCLCCFLRRQNGCSGRAVTCCARLVA